MSEQSQELSPSDLDKAIEYVKERLLCLSDSTMFHFEKISATAKRAQEFEQKLNEWSNKELFGETERCRLEAAEKRVQELEGELISCKRETIKECARQSTLSAIREKQLEIDKLEQQSSADKELIEKLVESLVSSRKQFNNILDYHALSHKDDELKLIVELAEMEPVLQLAQSKGYGKKG